MPATPTVSIHPPKTPVTKGSNSVSAATLPNICKMPGPPAPFILTPLPNIGRSCMSPRGYSKTVNIEGNPVAIRGASFASMGDIASRGTGGGIVSNNVEGETKFITPGSLTVKIEGKNVHLLADLMTNNNGPSGSPANAATLGGTLHMSQVAAGAARPGDTPESCPKGGDHEWAEVPGKSIDEVKQKNADNAAKAKDPDQARGYAFENIAIDKNMVGMDIQRAGADFKCGKCGQNQDVDIVGKDQVAEAKSRKFKGVKNKSKQARRIRDIQQKLFNKDKNPLAKVDSTKPDVSKSVDKYLERGFDVEVLS